MYIYIYTHYIYIDTLYIYIICVVWCQHLTSSLGQRQASICSFTTQLYWHRDDSSSHPGHDWLSGLNVQKKTVFEWKKHEKSQLPNFAPTFGWFSWIFMDFQSCFLFSTPINARRIALGSSTNRSGRCWWAKKTWAV